MEYTRVVHPLAPIFDRNSRVLLLGSMPSPKSRELGFYYAHPQNRFWRVLSGVFQEEIRADTASRTAFLLRHGIALWDVLHDCEIAGAGDQSIRIPQANDLLPILQQTEIRSVFTTGSKAGQLYERLCFPQTGIHARVLPSTSPANCRYSLEALISAYRAPLEDGETC